MRPEQITVSFNVICTKELRLFSDPRRASAFPAGSRQPVRDAVNGGGRCGCSQWVARSRLSHSVRYVADSDSRTPSLAMQSPCRRRPLRCPEAATANASERAVAAADTPLLGRPSLHGVWNADTDLF